MSPDPYFPSLVFAPTGPVGAPRVFIAPQRYVQGPGVLDHLGRYLALVGPRCAAVLVSAGGERRHGAALRASLVAADVTPIGCTFGGECSLEEVDRHVAALASQSVDCVIAVGGGKCVDTGKAIAFRLGVPIVIVPTLASNDAPCSAVSVLYTPAGVSCGVELYPNNPALVVVDTAIVAAADARFLVSGMGDAMATWYEAAVCLRNPAAMTTLGARPTIASAAIGEACATTLFAEGHAAAAAVAAGTVTPELEAVVEANTLLSGLGFESGGLAAAHAFAQSFTMLPQVNATYLHGEMVAMGTIAQLMIEARPEEARRVARFFAEVGLPTHLGHLGLDPRDAEAIETVVGGALGFPFIGNMPTAIDAGVLRQGLLAAHELGVAVCGELGDGPYRVLHGRC